MEITAAVVKEKGRALGADLVGIASGEVMNAHPPDPAYPQTPARISEYDAKSIIILAKRLLWGPARVHNVKRPAQYSAELILTKLEEISLDLVYFLERNGHPAITIPPTYTAWEPKEGMYGPLSLSHAAVEAGLGTLGLNLMLLTPEYGPRVLLAGVATAAELTPDPRMTTPLCLGPACGRCLMACPGDAILHWGLEKEKCAPYASPHGYRYLQQHLDRIMETTDKATLKMMLKSRESFQIWQGMLGGVGIYTGCNRCQEVCPVGADYADNLKAVQEVIPEMTDAKAERLAAMRRAEAEGDRPLAAFSTRWIGAKEEAS